MKSTLFKNAKLKGQDGLKDIYVENGNFKQIGVNLGDKVKAERTIDLDGKLTLPPYCDPHIHLDYVFTALNPAAANKTGVQNIRTHVDVTDPKLTALKALLELREEVKDTCELQIIAFPQEKVYAYKGGDELVEEALKIGADWSHSTFLIYT